MLYNRHQISGNFVSNSDVVLRFWHFCNGRSEFVAALPFLAKCQQLSSDVERWGRDELAGANDICPPPPILLENPPKTSEIHFSWKKLNTKKWQIWGAKKSDLTKNYLKFAFWSKRMRKIKKISPLRHIAQRKVSDREISLGIIIVPYHGTTVWGIAYNCDTYFDAYLNTLAGNLLSDGKRAHF